MDRRHGLLLACALAGFLLVSVVFRVRVLVASGKMALWTAAIVALVILLWPRPRQP